MTDSRFDAGDARLAAALRSGLAARDLEVRAPRFAALWPRPRTARATWFAWRPALATAAAVALIAAVPWISIKRSGGVIDASLAHELSSPAYWRVPSDELLAFAAPPLSAELPAPTGYQVSLEESLL